MGTRIPKIKVVSVYAGRDVGQLGRARKILGMKERTVRTFESFLSMRKRGLPPHTYLRKDIQRPLSLRFF